MDGKRLFMVMGPDGESVVYADGRRYGPANLTTKGRNTMSTARRIAELERKVEELGGDTPTKRAEDVELGFNVRDWWDEEDEPTAANEGGDLGFEVRDLWSD